MFNIGMPELILILVVALLIFGPTKLPELARSLGKGLAEFRRASSDLRAQLLDPPVETRPPTPAPPAATPQAAPATPPAEAGSAAQAEAGLAAQAEAGSAAPEGTTPVKEAAAGTSAQKQGQPSVG